MTVVDKDMATSPRQCQGNGSSYAHTTAGNDGNFPIELHIKV